MREMGDTEGLTGAVRMALTPGVGGLDLQPSSLRSEGKGYDMVFQWGAGDHWGDP